MWPLHDKLDLRVLALLLFIGILAVILRVFLDIHHFFHFCLHVYLQNSTSLPLFNPQNQVLLGRPCRARAKQATRAAMNPQHCVTRNVKMV